MSVAESMESPEYVNATVDEIGAWADRAGERGLLNPTTARLKVTALRRLLSVLADDEQLGAKEALETLDSLVVRLARKEGGNPETLGTYKQRAESILRDFLDYHANPLAFQNRSAERPVKAVPKASAEKKKADKPADKAESSQSVGEGIDANATRRFVFPLGNGRDFVYHIPVGGITMAEVKRVMFHLGSMATDFDPSAKDIQELTRRISPQSAADE